MILEYYLQIIEPYTKQLDKIFTSKLKIPLSIIVYFTGLIVVIFPHKFKTLLIFQHTSVTITTIAWFILSQKEHSNSSHFLFGSICAQITYFVTVKKITKNRFTFFLIICLFYLPLICSKYTNDLVYIFLCIFCFAICIYKVKLFIISVICFSGGCVTSGITCFWIKDEVICFEGILAAVLLSISSIIINFTLKKRKRKQKVYIERLDVDMAEVIEK